MFPVALWIAQSELTVQRIDQTSPAFCRNEATAMKLGRAYYLSYFNASDIPTLEVSAERRGDIWIVVMGGNSDYPHPLIEPVWMAIDRRLGGVRAMSRRSKMDLLDFLARPLRDSAVGRESRY